MKISAPLLILILLSACAKQTSPTGGPKDEMPPTLLESNPENKAVNFKGDKIELTFSELVQLNKPKEQIIISPSVKETLTEVKKEKVVLSFITPLEDSTTYSVNFREAVQDLTEKNPAANLKLAFSTGSYIDSLSIKGIAFDMRTNKPIPDVTVALHYQNDTFNILKHPAYIFTKSDKEGNFLIQNLKATSFFVYAFIDKNKNLIVDSKSEKYGFLSELLTLKDSIAEVVVPMVALDARPLKLISSRAYQNYYNIKTNKSFISYSIKYKDDLPTVTAIGDDLASVKIYQTFNIKDSVLASLNIVDSIGNKVDTTIYVKFNEPNEERILDKFKVEVEKPIVYLQSQELSTTIQLNKPLKSINYDSIYFELDSLTKFFFTAEEIKLDTQKLTLTLKKKLPKSVFEKPTEKNNNNTSKQISLPPANIDSLQTQKLPKVKELRLKEAALVSIDDDSSSYSTLKPVYFKTEDLGVILVETENISDPYFIEVVDTKGEVIQRADNVKYKTFSDIDPGEYSLRIVIDANKNGIWDAGNYFTKQEPEKVYYYANEEGIQTFPLKANFEIGPLLIKTNFSVNNLVTKPKLKDKDK